MATHASMDGINVAARLEVIAEPGSVCISDHAPISSSEWAICLYLSGLVPIVAECGKPFIDGALAPLEPLSAVHLSHF